MTLVYIALFFPLLPAILSIIKWKSMDTPQRWFAILLWSIVIISFSGRLWTIQTQESNLPFFYIYILIEYLILLHFFRILLKIKNSSWLFLTVGFTITWCINICTGKGWWAFPDYIHALEAIIIITLVILWFIKMLKEKTIAQPYKTFEFWICAGLLIFFSGNFLLFVFPKFILNTGNEVFLAIWKVNNILNILLYSIYTIALLCVKRRIR
ncbi:hypothetical protein [Dokdonia sp.]|uniref:hypothetical protein n=1 Tax=Dokdonia sp. TaxID=2024995 RepID=UPI00326488D0